MFSQGMRCQRCVYPARCNGCKISRDEDRVSLQPGDCLIVQASWADEDQQTSSNMADWDDMFDDGKIVDHNATACSYRNEPLTLDDCLKAFSERYARSLVSYFVVLFGIQFLTLGFVTLEIELIVVEFHQVPG